MYRPVASVSLFALLSGVGAAADLPTAPPPVLIAPTPTAFNWTGFYFGGHGGYGFGQAPFVDGAMAGGHVGANWQWDVFVLGAEADGSWVNWEGATSVGTVRVRAGMAANRFQLYATGGAAFRELDEVGWVAGAGGEYALTDRWIVGAEYLYYQFDPGAADVFRARASYRFPVNAGSPWPVLASPNPAAYDWSGFYFGGSGGYAFVSGDEVTSGYVAGGQVGVNRQINNVVVGLEIEGAKVDWTSVSTAGSIRLRGGYVLGRFLPYVAGGMGVEDELGWTVGGGLEFALTDRWSIGAEYLRHDFTSGHTADILRGRFNYRLTPREIADQPEMLSSTPIASNWSGFYFGGHGGWGFGSGQFTDGAMAGGQVGYNWQYGRFVVGFEGEGSWVDWDDANVIATGLGRGGVALGRFHAYGAYGLAAQDGVELVGWVAGGGAEYAFARNWTAGVEYLHYDFADDDSEVIRGRVNYHFGGPVEDDFTDAGIFDEVRLGGAAFFQNNAKSEEGFYITGQILFDTFVRPFDNVFLDILLRPRPHIGGSASPTGTDQVFAGLTWTIPFGRYIFAEASFGGTVHNGAITGSEVSLGCHALFRESVGLGANIGQHWRIIASADHSSHNEWCSDENDGLTHIGGSIGYRF